MRLVIGHKQRERALDAALDAVTRAGFNADRVGERPPMNHLVAVAVGAAIDRLEEELA